MQPHVAIENKEIRGITLKLMYLIVGGIVGIVFTVTVCYANLKQSIHDGTLQSVNNNTQLSMIQKQMADDNKEKNARITVLELQSAELKIEIKMLANKLGIDFEK